MLFIFQFKQGVQAFDFGRLLIGIKTKSMVIIHYYRVIYDANPTECYDEKIPPNSSPPFSPPLLPCSYSRSSLLLSWLQQLQQALLWLQLQVSLLQALHGSRPACLYWQRCRRDRLVWQPVVASEDTVASGCSAIVLFSFLTFTSSSSFFSTAASPETENVSLLATDCCREIAAVAAAAAAGLALAAAAPLVTGGF
uniref:Uncharacterized protein n=1 Tax=Pristionchus pacificus TaxID=54126 RepID=A0A2A6C6L6_PRIPA|eukprot:PDM73814.1 hypothetical protein PRIPAC_41170 [Pristionchus pacificus]